MGCSKSSPKREVYSDTILPHETRKIPKPLIPVGARDLSVACDSFALLLEFVGWGWGSKSEAESQVAYVLGHNVMTR